MRYVLALLLCAGNLFANDGGLQLKGDVIVVKVDKVVVVKEDRTVVRALPFKVFAPPGAADYRWTVPAGVAFTDTGDTIEITAAPKGELKISARMLLIDFEKKATNFKLDSIIFNVGDIAPPEPVTPKPDPKPVVPDPPKPAPPIAIPGFRVLFVVESSDLSKLPPEQVPIFTATPILSYLKSHCIQIDGFPEYRIWDQDTPTANVSKTWRDAMALPRSSLPWIIISNGDTGYSGPLPANVADTLNLLKKYGGS